MSAADLASDERAARSTGSPVLGMVLFVASEGMFFATFLAIYAMSYSSQPAWPPKGIPVPGLGLASVFTGVMVVSSLTMHLGLRAVRAGDVGRLSRWIVVTLALGAAYVILQVVELGRTGFGIDQGIYASLYYVLTAVALAHVAGGLAFLAMIFVRSATGQLGAARHEPANALAIYWHFVVVITVVMYVAFYLLVNASPKGR